MQNEPSAELQEMIDVLVAKATDAETERDKSYPFLPQFHHFEGRRVAYAWAAFALQCVVDGRGMPGADVIKAEGTVSR